MNEFALFHMTPLIVRPVLGIWIVMATTSRLPARHHPLAQRPGANQIHLGKLRTHTLDSLSDLFNR